MGPTHESVSNDFGFHPATDLTAETNDAVRANFQSLAHWVLDNVPAGNAQTNSIDRLRESMMWANGAVECDTVKAVVQPSETS